jgi:hypothetical protein
MLQSLTHALQVETNLKHEKYLTATGCPPLNITRGAAESIDDKSNAHSVYYLFFASIHLDIYLVLAVV